jgi:rRNA-processing protein FCF1
VLLVDTANVVGSRPTGWWRDRAAATRQLVERVRTAVSVDELPQPVVMVLEGAARRGVDEGCAGGVEIVHAPGEGDDTLADIAAAATERVIVVSADRGLHDRVRRPGVEIVGPNWLLDRLPA